MSSDDTPGSPRKKAKLELTTSVDTTMDTTMHSPERGDNTSHLPIPIEHTNDVQNPSEPHFAPQPSDPQTNPDLPATAPRADMAMSTPELTQVEKERAVGITEFVRPDLLGFTGTLKKRYTDFMVNEILPSGEVVHLTNLKGPNKTQSKQSHVQRKEEHAEEKKDQTEKAPSKIQHAAQQDEAMPQQNASGQNGEPSLKTDDAQRIKSVAPDTAQQDEAMPQQKASGQSGEPSLKTDDVHRTETVAPVIANGNGQKKFDKVETSPTHQGELPPHMRVHNKTPSSSPNTSPSKETPTRTRQQYIIRHTENGWAEFDAPKEDKKKHQKIAGSTSNVDVLRDAFTNHAPTEENIPPKKDSSLSTSPSQQSSSPKAKDAIAAQWQAYANSTPNYQGNETSSSAQWQAYANPNGESSAVTKTSDEDKAKLLSYFSEPVVDAIRSLYNRVLNSPHRSARDYGKVTSAAIDRPLRTKIHQDIRQIFQSRLESMTDRDGAIVISAMPSAANAYHSTSRTGHNDRGHGQAGGRTGQNGSRGQSGGHGKPKWEELGGEYLHFSLYKENKDTMECISWLAKCLKLGAKSFEFAGTKDRRAVTVQRVSVYRQTFGRMIDAGKTLRHANIGNYEYRPTGLQLGELTGNEFVITLRDCKFGGPNMTSDNHDQAYDIVNEALKNFLERGFINYYGLQRFGTFSTSTSDVGVKILQGDFESAVDAILDYSPESLAASQSTASEETQVSRDDKARARAIHMFVTTRNAHQAVADLPRKFSAESTIMRHLGSKPAHQRDYAGAIMTIPRNLRLMYVHAYQSLVWNMAASKRWSSYGDTVVEGDLVLVTEHPKESQAAPQEVDEDGEPVLQPATHDRATNVEDSFTRARVLSKEEAESGKYTIFDIVLPTPGFDILHPSNEIGKFYEEFMASSAGGGLDPHNMRRPQRDFSLSGSYRKLIARPGKDASFEIKTYEADDEQFIDTDMDRLKNVGNKGQHVSHTESAKEATALAPAADSSEHIGEKGEGNTQPEKHKGSTDDDAMSLVTEDNSEYGGGVSLPAKNKKIAVVLKLQLGSSQYATMALRELMKADGVMTYKPDFGGGR